MALNLRQLDALSYDDVEPILDDYIKGAIDEFVNSPEGEAHVKDYPNGGYWIGTFIEFGYNYGETTLPKMTKGDVQMLMESTVPRKVVILDPSEAEDAIPELVAFWRFLQRQYNLRSANAIVKYLESIAAQFPRMMSDPARGGIAKTFMMMGQQAGFDMMNPEGIEAFQQQYNASPNLDSLDPIANSLRSLIDASLASPSLGQSASPRSKPKGMAPQSNSAKKTTHKKNSKKKK